MTTKTTIFTVLLALSVTSFLVWLWAKDDEKGAVSVENTSAFTAYRLSPSHLDLACGQRPSETDESIVMSVAATWTGKCSDTFSHENIASDHVSGGVFYKGYEEPRNTGCFVWFDKQFEFVYGAENHSQLLQKAASKKGMGFCQEMMIHEGKRVPTKRKDDNVNLFRALCKKDSSLYVIDAKEKEPFGTFIGQLLTFGVTEALYLDMGPGWNYSWYRDEKGELHHIHEKKNQYSTNWLVIYK